MRWNQLHLQSTQSDTKFWEFPGDLLVSIQCFHQCSLGSIPVLGTVISHQATTQKKKKKMCVRFTHIDCFIAVHSFSWLSCLTLCQYNKIIFILSVADEHLGSFPFGDITNSSARDILVMCLLMTICVHFFRAFT